MAIRFTIFFTSFLISALVARVAIAQSGAELPPPSFDAASPTKGLWKGWPVGMAVTFEKTFTDRQFNIHSVQFVRQLLVGRSADGTGLIAGYRAERKEGPWQFARTASAELLGFMHEPGIQQVSARMDKLSVGTRPIDCMVRSYSGTRETRWSERVEGEEWTIGPDGPPIKSSVQVSSEFSGIKFDLAERLSCIGQEPMKNSVRDLTVFHTVDGRLMDGKAIGGNTHRYWSDEVPGWLVRLRSWNQPDEQQPPAGEDDLIAFGSDAELLARYVKTDRPPEIEMVKMLMRFPPATAPTSMPKQ